MLPISYSLKMEAAGSFDTLVNFNQTELCHIPEDAILLCHSHKDLIHHINKFVIFEVLPVLVPTWVPAVQSSLTWNSLRQCHCQGIYKGEDCGRSLVLQVINIGAGDEVDHIYILSDASLYCYLKHYIFWSETEHLRCFSRKSLKTSLKM